MAKLSTRVFTAHIPQQLAEKIDAQTEKLDRSRGWVIKQALMNWIDQEEERDRLTREALADVDHGHVFDQKTVEKWAGKPTMNSGVWSLC